MCTMLFAIEAGSFRFTSRLGMGWRGRIVYMHVLHVPELNATVASSLDGVQCLRALIILGGNR